MEMRKFLFGAIVVIGIMSVYSGCEGKGEEVNTVVTHDTIYKDSFIVTERDTVFYEAKWLRNRFETAGKAYWKNYGDSYQVAFPEFMNKVYQYQGERHLRLEYHGISMVMNAYDDKYAMSVSEKYEELKKSAVTKSLADSSFLLAGKCGNDRLYFEKDIWLRGRTWMFLRVEFPSELTWAVDPLLHYVKEYRP